MSEVRTLARIVHYSLPLHHSASVLLASHLTAASSLQVCQHCNMVAYCSNRCRVAGTAEHRLECLILSRSQHCHTETDLTYLAIISDQALQDFLWVITSGWLFGEYNIEMKVVTYLFKPLLFSCCLNLVCCQDLASDPQWGRAPGGALASGRAGRRGQPLQVLGLPRGPHQGARGQF